MFYPKHFRNWCNWRFRLSIGREVGATIGMVQGRTLSDGFGQPRSSLPRFDTYMLNLPCTIHHVLIPSS